MSGGVPQSRLIGQADAAEAADAGYNYLRWAKGGMSFWAVSDLNRDKLRDFVETWQRE